VDRLDAFDWAIFVSPNAVHKALTAITLRRSLPPSLKFAAVGRGTVKALAKFGLNEVAAPARFDSEALLELEPMQNVAAKWVAIFRGVGGRDTLADALKARGARVEYAECYRRVVPASDPAPLLAAWNEGGLDAIVVTSSEGVRNLGVLVGAQGRDSLMKTPVFAPHARIARTARELGIATVVETAQGDDGLLAGLQAWFEARI
jgi:uroporphyrinogen-III synthase